ncbi:MAG TPA: exonuclease SbcCD subunit D C-terminal domain-containing protein, partial [Clostridia bacterium]|nr:exonuclease SbcCD subunit D C-terminal domain-containing protein [Clostridia bacterium]
MNRIREFYPNAMQLSYEREVMPEQNEVGLSLKGKAPLELFEEFYSYQNDRPLDEESRQFIKPLLFELESGVEE